MTAAFVCDHSGGYMQQRQSKPHVSPSPTAAVPLCFRRLAPSDVTGRQKLPRARITIDEEEMMFHSCLPVQTLWPNSTCGIAVLA